MTTRSTRLAAFVSSAAGQVTVYTSPPGMVTLFKSSVLQVDGAAAIDTQLVVATPTIYISLLNETLAAGSITNWDHWVVLEAGDVIAIVASAAGLRAWLSGAVLPARPP